MFAKVFTTKVNTENYENENIEGENYEVTVYYNPLTILGLGAGHEQPRILSIINFRGVVIIMTPVCNAFLPFCNSNP